MWLVKPYMSPAENLLWRQAILLSQSSFVIVVIAHMGPLACFLFSVVLGGLLFLFCSVCVRLAGLSRSVGIFRRVSVSLANFTVISFLVDYVLWSVPLSWYFCLWWEVYKDYTTFIISNRWCIGPWSTICIHLCFSSLSLFNLLSCLLSSLYILLVTVWV